MSDQASTPDEVEENSLPAEPELLHGVPVSYSIDMQVLHPSVDQLVATVEALRGDGFIMCLDVTAVDYLSHPGRDLPDDVAPERFEVVVTLISHVAAQRIRLRVQVPADEPVVPTLFDQFPGTEALEREVFDMYGISFDGHPDMSRILMPEDWDGHPLRKDYGVGRVPVQFKGAPK